MRGGEDEVSIVGSISLREQRRALARSFWTVTVDALGKEERSDVIGRDLQLQPVFRPGQRSARNLSMWQHLCHQLSTSHLSPTSMVSGYASISSAARRTFSNELRLSKARASDVARPESPYVYSPKARQSYLASV